MPNFLTKIFESEAQKRERIQKEHNDAFLELVRAGNHDEVTSTFSYYNSYAPDDDTRGFALINAAARNDVKMIEILVNTAKADINFDKGNFYSTAYRQDGGAYSVAHPGVTPLIMAASAGAYAAVEKLIELKASIDSVMQDGRSALMLAAEHGRTDTTRILLYAGADIHFRNSQNQRALEIAKANKHFEVERLVQAAHDKKPLPQVSPRVTVEDQPALVVPEPVSAAPEAKAVRGVVL